MKLKYFFLSVIFFFSFQIHGQSLLWQIDGPNMQGPSFLFGSMHRVCRDEFRWDKEVMNTIISDTKRGFFEVDLDSWFSPSTTIMQGDTTLNQLYTPDEYNFVKESFKKRKINLDKYLKINPLSFSFNYYTMPDGEKNKKCYPMSYDQYIADKYHNKGMNLVMRRVIGLETQAERDSILHNFFPYKTQAKMLLEMLRDTSSVFRYQDLLDIYFKMDIEKLYEFSVGTKESSIYSYAVLDARNLLWMERIPLFLKEYGPTMFVVGAAHLGGKNGLINLLKQKGYTVRPVPLDLKKRK
jgi:uncharacterized protein